MGVKHFSFAFTLCLACCYISILPAFEAIDIKIKEAQEAYLEGETAESSTEKEQAFNRALKLYLQLEGEPGNGKLFYNIGNTYFQLGEYGWAILYYSRALNLMPRNNKAFFQRILAQTKQGLPLSVEEPILDKLFFWHRLFSFQERLWLSMVAFMVTFAVLSGFIWTRLYLFKALSITSVVVTFLLFGSVLTSQYLSPVRAVMVGSYGLYHGPGERFALSTQTPMIAGVEVIVEEISDDGEWFKIETKEGLVGYVPVDTIRII